ncbi:MAG: amidase [Myxococcota bacterium]
MGDPASLDATGQAELARKGEVTPAELVEAAIVRIEKQNPRLNAVITPLFEKARAQAAGSLPEGPFRGVPFLLKDLVAESAGDPSHSGMKLLREVGFVAPQDTYLTTKFRQAGFVIVGRTNTPELGLVATTEPAAYGPTRNPWNLEHSTGGSSGGSAAAVAAGLVPAAHANDGGGSIRIPASECGLVGLKPSRGRVSQGPYYGEALAGLAVEGAVTRSVRDTAGILDAISGPMPGDPYTAPAFERPLREELDRPPGRLRIGLLARRPGEGPKLHPECVAAVEGAARRLESLGHSVETSHPEALDDSETTACFFDVWNVGTVYELEQIGQRIGREIRAEDVEPVTWASSLLGRAVSASRYVAAVGRMHAWTRRVASWWESGFDLLLTPTLAEPPPRLGELAGTNPNPAEAWRRNGEVAAFTPLFNVTGQPAISLPLHWSAEGLPVGVQLVAPYAREDLLIRIAGQLEQAQPWCDRRPGL